MAAKPKPPGGMTSASRKPRGAAAIALSPTPGGAGAGPRGLIPISVRLPAAYLRILGTEAALLGLRRNAFLASLLRRKLGKMKLERSEGAPEYTVTDRELEDYKQYTWHCDPDIRRLLDADIKQMGLTSYSSWINVALNEWIGRPGGLRSMAWRTQQSRGEK